MKASPPVRMNDIPVGGMTIPSEMVKVRYKDRDTFIQVFYDKGSQLSLVNKYCTPLIISSRKSDKPIRLGTIDDKTCDIRSIEGIYLGEGWQIEAILHHKLEVRTAPIKRPSCFAKYDNNWASQLGTSNCDQLPAQILLGADCARIFPVNVVHPNGTPVQTKHCRLMRSVLTGQYLLFGASEPSDKILEIEFPPN